MKILFLEWKSFGNEDILQAFEQLNASVYRFPFTNKDPRSDEVIEQELVKAMIDFQPDFVFSFNYFPVVSIACKKCECKYVAWIYDNPYVLLYSYTIINPVNYVFVFDKSLYKEFHNAGIRTVHYLPLAVNTARLAAMNSFDLLQNTHWNPQTDIAFIGSLYTEKHQFYQRLEGITPYTRGYLEGLMAVQKQIYGMNFIQDLLPADIIEDMKRVLPMEPSDTGVESIEYLYAQYVINRQLTAVERKELLSAVGAQFSLDLYTPDKTAALPGCINHGPVDYYDMAPYIFKTSKINLNITLRSIKTGIPLRAFDIIGAGGFLLTNYQEDFADCFVPGEDFVYYESKEDLLHKIEYFLSHDKERMEIAQNGLARAAQNHTYEHRLREIMSIINENEE